MHVTLTFDHSPLLKGVNKTGDGNYSDTSIPEELNSFNGSYCEQLVVSRGQWVILGESPDNRRLNTDEPIPPT